MTLSDPLEYTPPTFEDLPDPKHDIRLGMAYKIAQQSPDPSTQNGSVLVVRDNYKLNFFYGFNAPPVWSGILKKDLEDREFKKGKMIHAEAAAIFEAVSAGVDIRGASLYSTWPPCPACANTIASCGVGEFVFWEPAQVLIPERWQKETEEGLRLLGASPTKVTAWLDKITVHEQVELLLDEHMWCPYDYSDNL